MSEEKKDDSLESCAGCCFLFFLSVVFIWGVSEIKVWKTNLEKDIATMKEEIKTLQEKNAPIPENQQLPGP